MPRLDAERIDVWRRLCTVSVVIQRRIDRELEEEHGIPLAWYEVLAAVRSAGGSIRVHELAAALDEIPSSLSRRLDRMTDDGLVQRENTPSKDDRRAVTVHLTSEGRAVWRDATVTYRQMVQEHFARHLTESDVHALQRVWVKMP